MQFFRSSSSRNGVLVLVGLIAVLRIGNVVRGQEASATPLPSATPTSGQAVPSQTTPSPTTTLTPDFTPSPIHGEPTQGEPSEGPSPPEGPVPTNGSGQTTPTSTPSLSEGPTPPSSLPDEISVTPGPSLPSISLDEEPVTVVVDYDAPVDQELSYPTIGGSPTAAAGSSISPVMDSTPVLSPSPVISGQVLPAQVTAPDALSTPGVDRERVGKDLWGNVSAQVVETVKKVAAAVGDAVEQVFETVADPFLPDTRLKLLETHLRAQDTVRIRVKGKTDDLRIKILDLRGQRLDVIPKLEEVNGEQILTIEKPSRFKPGKYHIEVERKGEVILEQDFEWGVLAINLNKSVYRPGEKAKLSLAVLDERGEMVCDAGLELRIESGELRIKDKLSTGDGTISVNDECNLHGFTLEPDYEAEYQVGEVGVYEMELTAQTENGTYTINDAFEVREAMPFDIDRTSATRIYPPATYPMTMFVKVNQDFRGVVEEPVPKDFEISSVTARKLNQETADVDATGSTELLLEFDQSGDNQAQVVEQDDRQIIQWRVDWQSGDIYELSYQFDAPDISPQFYLLGPLRLTAFGASVSSWSQADSQEYKELVPSVGEGITFEEIRRWQLAIDSTQITSANSNQISEGNARMVVRTSGGTLYAVVHDGSDGGIEIWRSSDGSSWAEQDSGNNPQQSGRYGTPSTAIDSSDIIHISYWDANGGQSAIRYVTFVTSSDSFSGDIEIWDIGGGNPAPNGTAITIDHNDVPHIAWMDSIKVQGTDYNTIYYTNKVGGSWNTQVEVESSGNKKQNRTPDITIVSGSGIPAVSYRNSTDFDIGAALGNANNATSFTLQDIETGSGATGGTSIAVDSGGNTYIAYANGANEIRIGKHNGADSWTTWQTLQTVVDSTGAGNPPSLAIDGTDLYVFAPDGNDDVVYYKSTNYTSWDSPVTLDTGTYQGVKVKWAFWVDNDSNGALVSGATYYFDGSDVAATDPDAAWTNETNADDGNVDTDATTSTSGGETTNYIEIQGTNAPASGDDIIVVKARAHNGTSWSSYQLVPQPSGGWTWTKIQGLEMRVAWNSGVDKTFVWIYEDGNAGGTELLLFEGNGGTISKIEVEVFIRSSSAELDYLFQTANDVYWNKLTLSGGGGFDVSGTFYPEAETGNEPGQCDGSTENLTLRVDGASPITTSCADTSGTFTFSGVSASAGQTVTIYSTGADKTNRVYVSDGTADTGMDLYHNAVAVGDEQDGSLTILDTLDWDDSTEGAATDMLFDSVDDTTDTMTLLDGAELHIHTGDTFAPGGTITTSPSASSSTNDGDIHIDGTGTLDVGTNALSVGGDFDNEGTFTKSSGQTTTFTATATGHTITDGGENFDTVVFNGSGGGWSFADATTIDVDLTMTDGTLSGTNSITVNGGDVTGNGDINLTSGTFTVNTAGDFGGTNDWDFSSLTIGAAGDATTTAVGSGSITVASVLTIDTGDTLDAKGMTWTLSGTGTPLVVSGTLNDSADTSTFAYTGNGATNITASAAYNNLNIYPGGASVTHTLASGTFTLTGNLNLGGNTNAASTVVTAGTNNPTINVGGNLTICAATCSNQMTFTKSSNTLTLSPTGTKTWTDNNPTTKQDVGVVSISGGASTPKINLGSDVDATSITIASGHILDANGSNTLTLHDDFTNNGGSGGFVDSTGTVVFDTAGNTSTLLYSAATTFNNFTVSTGGKPMQFDNVDQTNVAGTLTIQGTDCTTGRVFLDSSVNDDQWALNATGTIDIDYADIEDSNAIAAAWASNSTEDDYDSNTGWTVNRGDCSAISFAISDTTIEFGTLDSGAARFADDLGGNPTETEAHTITASSNAPGGYVIEVEGATMTAETGGYTITAIGGTNTASSPGSEQFGLRATVNSGTGIVTAPYAAAGFAYAADSGVTDQIASGLADNVSTEFSLRYVCNITSATEANLYTATLTYTVTGTF